MLDDRMKPENLKEVAASIMGQQPRVSLSEGDAPSSTAHPDASFAKGLFSGNGSAGEKNESYLDLSPLTETNSRRAEKRGGSLREDLVQQAAQALVKNQNDAFLAITSRMSPEEILSTLQTARQWRRPDPSWQNTFRSAPETGFRFIDRSKGSGSGENKAESLAREITEHMRSKKIPAEEAYSVVQKFLEDRGLKVGEKYKALFAARVAGMV